MQFERQSQLSTYVDRLLSAFYVPFPMVRAGSRLSEKIKYPQQSSLPEPLSDRELEVLHLIAEGASNRDISERLVIANQTVKRHVSNIFNKLGVSSRTQAVAAGRDLGLI
jgi:LuxR family maltose regulon positive regulatory protein